jgi:hypothetical protein
MHACFGWISLPHTESMRSETPRQLSQRGVRLHVNGVNARVRLHVNWINTEVTNIYEDFIIPRWLSWRGVSLCVDSVDIESHLALTQLTGNETRRQLSHHQMLKNSYKSTNSSTKSKTLESLIIWPIVCFISAKNWNKKISCKCTFNTMMKRKIWIFLYDCQEFTEKFIDDSMKVEKLMICTYTQYDHFH